MSESGPDFDKLIGDCLRGGDTHLPGLGHCIYCGSPSYQGNKTRPLGEEHIVPLALGGQLILDAASCHRCECIINRYEQKYLRGVLRNFRAAAKLPTRNPDQRPTHGEVELRGEVNARLSVPIREMLNVVMLPQLAGSGLLRGVEYGPGFPRATWRAALLGFDQPTWNHPQYAFSARVDATSLTRMVAKIGLAFAVARLRLALPAYASLTAVVLAQEAGTLNHVGHALTVPAPSRDGLHALRLVGARTTAGLFLTVDVHLFGNIPEWKLPGFNVVVMPISEADFEALACRVDHPHLLEPKPDLQVPR